MINRTELIEVGFFDERLLGLGEEDGDFCWRYHERYDYEIRSITIPGIANVQSDLADPGYAKGIRTQASSTANLSNSKSTEMSLLAATARCLISVSSSKLLTKNNIRTKIFT